MDRQRLDRLVTEHQGRVTSESEDGRQVRVEFPVSTRAAGFYDAVFGDAAGVDLTPDSCGVVVDL